ncbi:MAG: adenosylhomocysteinase [Solirubrobacterales bacterium]|jgi:adenosylhomocysteinase|nr:adenosylhomocysteinase [Solirubrobacterales bacterium]
MFSCPLASLVSITHILDTAVPYIEEVSRALEIDAVIGIPYSTKPAAQRRLEEQGHRVVIPTDLASLPEVAEREIRRASDRRGGPVIVQEIGGYCAPLIDGLTAEGRLAGVVEDTKQGHWVYAERSDLPCPVLSIAESPLKALENQQVGRSISHALETVLRRRFHRLLPETRVGVLGYGGIGEATARAISSHGARVAAFDVCGIRMAKAALDGFGDTDRERLISESDVLLGVSGHKSITEADLLRMCSGGIVASGSSKQVEIDLLSLQSLGRLSTESEWVKQYELEGGKRVSLLNDGLPINFLEQSILGRVLDLVYTELFMCMREIALEQAKNELASLDIARQREIAETWHRIHWC